MEGNSRNNIEAIENELNRLFKNPEEFVYGFETDRFRGYCARWSEQKKIGEVWEEKEAPYFPISFSDAFYRQLKQVDAENFDLYMKALASVDAPYVLCDILTRQVGMESGWSTVLKVLKESVLCKKGDDIFDDDIDSVLAPAALDVLVSHILYSKEPSSDVLQRVEQIAEVLQNREDGFYLSYHLVKYLLWRDLKKEYFYDFLEILSCGFEEGAKKYLIFDDKVKVEGLKDLSENAAKDFMFTGILNTVKETDVLLNFRTILRFIQEDASEEQLWNAFKRVYACDAQSFITNDFNFNLKHFDICNLILSQEDILDAWKEINEMVQGCLHRLSIQYYEGQAMDLRCHIYFMWEVNLQIVDCLCKEDRALAADMWNLFWNDGLAYARRFAKYQEDYVYQYLCRLICYYVCFVNDKPEIEEKEIETNCVCMEKMMAIFKEIENMPILVLLSLKMLQMNGLSRWDMIAGAYENFFAEIFDRAWELAAGQNKYEWVLSYLKKMRFAHKEHDNFG